MEIPRGTKNSACEIELDVVNPIFNTVSNGFDETVRAVAFKGMARSEEMTTACGKEIPAGEQTWPNELAGFEATAPRDIHVVMGACTAESHDARFQQGCLEAVAEQSDLLGQRHVGQRVVVGVNMNVPQSRKKVGALQIDDLVARLECAIAARY